MTRRRATFYSYEDSFYEYFEIYLPTSQEALANALLKIYRTQLPECKARE